jgi:hypothetical protein
VDLGLFLMACPLALLLLYEVSTGTGLATISTQSGIYIATRRSFIRRQHVISSPVPARAENPSARSHAVSKRSIRRVEGVARGKAHGLQLIGHIGI